MKKYKVTLSMEERKHVCELIATGKADSLKTAHARILLKAEPGLPQFLFFRSRSRTFRMPGRSLRTPFAHTGRPLSPD